MPITHGTKPIAANALAAKFDSSVNGVPGTTTVAGHSVVTRSVADPRPNVKAQDTFVFNFTGNPANGDQIAISIKHGITSPTTKTSTTTLASGGAASLTTAVAAIVAKLTSDRTGNNVGMVDRLDSASGLTNVLTIKTVGGLDNTQVTMTISPAGASTLAASAGLGTTTDFEVVASEAILSLANVASSDALYLSVNSLTGATVYGFVGTLDATGGATLTASATKLVALMTADTTLSALIVPAANDPTFGKVRIRAKVLGLPGLVLVTANATGGSMTATTDRHISDFTTAFSTSLFTLSGTFANHDVVALNVAGVPITYSLVTADAGAAATVLAGHIISAMTANGLLTAAVTPTTPSGAQIKITSLTPGAVGRVVVLNVASGSGIMQFLGDTADQALKVAGASGTTTTDATGKTIAVNLVADTVGTSP